MAHQSRCPNCGGEMIPGVFPGSEGWCRAECDLITQEEPTTTPEQDSWVNFDELLAESYYVARSTGALLRDYIYRITGGLCQYLYCGDSVWNAEFYPELLQFRLATIQECRDAGLL